jgi:hypothetical protein
VQAVSFKLFEAVGVTLSAGDRLRVDAQMTTGAVSETVTVSDTNTNALQTDSSTVQSSIDSQQVRDIPMNGRNFISLVQVQPGVTAGNPGSVVSGGFPDDRRQGSNFSANGQYDAYNNNLVDGLDNNERQQGLLGVRPSIDAIADVRVFTSNFPAEVGRASGAVVNVLTKAGTNSFHGTAFEFLRNDFFDARNFFASAGSEPEYRQHQFGGSIGGPIFKNKAFFFGAVEETRIIQGQTFVDTVPTLFEEQNPGNLSDIGGPVLTPDQISPVSLNYFKMFPAPNTPATLSNGIPTNNYINSPNKTQFGRTIDARVDYHFNDTNSIFVHYGYNPVSTYQPPELPPASAFGKTVYNVGVNSFGGIFSNIDGPSSTTTQGVAVDYVHVFSPSLVMELKTGYTRVNIASLPQNYGTNLAGDFGVNNSNLGTPASSGVPVMLFFSGPYSSLGDGFFVPLTDINNVYQYNGVVTYSRGKHSFKAGAALIRRQLNYVENSWSPQGGFVFGPSLANFLEGISEFSERGNQLNQPGYRTWEPSVFVQDDWRLTPRFTLNLGIRYEIFTPFTESHNQYANFDAASLSVKVAGQGISDTLGLSTKYGDFSPRLGFAYSLPDGKSVLRGGFSFSYNPSDTQAEISLPNPPFQYVCFPCFGATFPTLILPQVSLATPSGALAYKDPAFGPSTMRQYSLTFERRVGPVTASVGYVGVQGVNLPSTTYYNVPDPTGPVAPGTPAPPLLYHEQLPNVTLIDWYRNNGRSNYNSLQTSLRYQPKASLSFNMNYTWSHNLDNVANGSNLGAQGYVKDDLNYDYGNAPLDIRHHIAGVGTYQLPFGHNLRGIEGILAKGWQGNLLGYWQTGMPVTVSNGSPRVNLPNITSDRPNQLGDASLGGKSSIKRFFDTTKFAPQTLGTLGTAREGSLFGPRDRRLDLSLFKSFTIYRESALQFRWEVFNVTNTPNFGGPDSGLTDANFGEITSTRPQEYPRQMQFALKFSF